jgi:hypothetical protein
MERMLHPTQPIDVLVDGYVIRVGPYGYLCGGVDERGDHRRGTWIGDELVSQTVPCSRPVSVMSRRFQTALEVARGLAARRRQQSFPSHQRS